MKIPTIENGFGLWLGSPDLATTPRAEADPKCPPGSCSCNEVASPIPVAENVQAAWSPTGLLLSFYAGGRVQTINVTERGQASLRSALGVAR